MQDWLWGRLSEFKVLWVKGALDCRKTTVGFRLQHLGSVIVAVFWGG